MTKEQAKIFMLQLNTEKILNKSEHEAIRVAIKALEQQSSEDCVSRQDAIVQLSIDLSEIELPRIKESLDKLPPVTPTFPKGATNGDVITAMFPKCCSNMGNFDNGIVVDFMGDLHSFDTDWWNAPYKRGNENAAII